MRPIVHSLGQVEYEPTWRAMQAFTEQRTADTADEIWVVEHPPVFTQGLAGKPEHLLHHTAIPVVKTDRGGQITYHGPGQLVVYLLLNVKRYGYGVRELVRRIERAVIALLAQHGIEAYGDVNAPGVYVNGAKIASLGLRIRNGATYHGLSLNVDMDLSPFSVINPCGYAGLAVTQLRQLGITLSVAECAAQLLPHLYTQLEAEVGEDSP